MSPRRWLVLWDGRQWPGRMLDGLPAFDFGCAPAELLTRRQLRDKGLSPGGQEPYARLVWKRDRRWAWLYVEDRARPKRTASPAQFAAIGNALAARRVCAVCGPVDHCVRTTDRLCGDCHATGVQPPTAIGPATWDVTSGWATSEAEQRGAA